jgi:hypothetical protein
MPVSLSAAKNLFPQMPAEADMQTSPDQREDGMSIASAGWARFRRGRHGKVYVSLPLRLRIAVSNSA